MRKAAGLDAGPSLATAGDGFGLAAELDNYYSLERQQRRSVDLRASSASAAGRPTATQDVPLAASQDSFLQSLGPNYCRELTEKRYAELQRQASMRTRIYNGVTACLGCISTACQVVQCFPAKEVEQQLLKGLSKRFLYFAACGSFVPHCSSSGCGLLVLPHGCVLEVCYFAYLRSICTNQSEILATATTLLVPIAG